MTSTPWVDALLSADGHELLQALAAEDGLASREVQILTRYRQRYPADLVAAAFAQTQLRARARAKFSRADRMYFTEAGLEQASTERMATHHARRFHGISGIERVVDLCSGIGGDLIGFARDHHVTAVDSDALHSRLGVLNAGAYGVAKDVTAVCTDVRDLDYRTVSAAFIDPARRSQRGRMRSGDSEPPLDWCFALGSRIALGVKAAPTLPLEVVPASWEIEFVSEQRELKESLLWSPALAQTSRRATVLGDGEHTLVEEPAVSRDVKAPGSYLLDPDPAVTRAGLVETLAAKCNAWKIDGRVAFLSTDRDVSTPFARTLRVEASMPWSLARLKESLRSLDIGPVDIRKRGSAVDVEEIQRRLKLTGSRAATVVLTRVNDQPWAFVCV